jgi:hypothetical protein
MLRLVRLPVLLWMFVAFSAAADPVRLVSEAALPPVGQRYHAIVLDTLDLAERARLSVHGLTCCLDERANYGPYGHTYFDATPPQRDLDSYLPYEGKLVIRNKTARKLSVRVPGWVEMAAVRCSINRRPAAPFAVGRYLVFDRLPARAEVTLTFPMPETTEVHSQAWQQSDFWQECTDPGSTWKKAKLPKRYVCRFRGNTLRDISPRDEGMGYPLYQREALQGTNAPMKSVERYIARVLPRW